MNTMGCTGSSAVKETLETDEYDVEAELTSNSRKRGDGDIADTAGGSVKSADSGPGSFRSSSSFRSDHSVKKKGQPDDSSKLSPHAGVRFLPFFTCPTCAGTRTGRYKMVSMEAHVNT